MYTNYYVYRALAVRWTPIPCTITMGSYGHCDQLISSKWRVGIGLFVYFLAVFANSASGQCAASLQIPLDDTPVNISSPNYPARYNNSLDCRWRLTYQTGQGVTVRFFDFDTEERYDKLILAPSNSSDETLSYDGNRLPHTIYLPWNGETWIMFETDGGGHRGRGFLLQVAANRNPVCLPEEYVCNYEQIFRLCMDTRHQCDFVTDCDDGSDEKKLCSEQLVVFSLHLCCTRFCFDEEVTLSPGEVWNITSPGYPGFYPADLKCPPYHVIAPNESIALRVMFFETEFIFDLFSVKPYLEADYKKSLVIQGVRAPDNVYTNRDQVWLFFESDLTENNVYTGFQIEISASKYNISDCSNNLWPCNDTFLTCYDRDYLCDTLMDCPSGIDERNCAGIVNGETQVVDLTSWNTTTLTSPSYPLYYPSNIDVQWQILSPPESTLRLVFLNFSLAINEDFLYINLNDSKQSSEPLRRYTGSYVEKIALLSDRAELWLRLLAGDSNSVVTGMGFVIQLNFTDTPECDAEEFSCDDKNTLITCLRAEFVCNCEQQCVDGSDEGSQCANNPMTIDAPSARGIGLLTTPGFPNVHYNNDMQCWWLIKAAKSNRIAIAIHGLALESRFDTLSIETTNGTKKNIVLLTRETKLTQLTGMEDQLTVAFVSDRTVVDKGFDIEYWQYDSITPSCEESDFQCNSLSCVKQSSRCDGIDDCLDDTDEEGCDDVICQDTFQCDNTTCIVNSEVCDGDATCNNGSDEHKCDVIMCPEDCACTYEDERLVIQCLQGETRSTHGVSDLPQITNDLEITAENGFLRPGIFKTVQRLEKLTMTIGLNTTVNEIPLRTFDRLNHLIYLNLTKVYNLDIVLNNTFAELTSLQALILWQMQNTQFEPGALKGLNSLQTLVVVTGYPVTDKNKSFIADQVNNLPKITTVYVDEGHLCCGIPDSISCVLLKSTYSMTECGSMLGNTFKAVTPVLGVLAITGNIAVIIFLFANRNVQIGQIQCLLLINLSTSHLLMGIYILIIFANDIGYGEMYQTLSTTWQTSRTCHAASFVAFLASQASISFLLLLALDRLFSIATPFKSIRFNMKSTFGAAAFVWGVSLILSLVYISLVGAEDKNEFGLSDICFTLPYFIKPNLYTVFLGNTSSQFNLPFSHRMTPRLGNLYPIYFLV
ncbi:CUB and sushi domain-containing protein 2-like [Amphiura filiformis]|uniref:CUB and sushi domain-containing protein 2-like n=1 Tax=Amphiura filiformis TaxID=82378 RepID=UPI003B219164